MVEDRPEYAVDTEFELVRRGYDQQQVDGHLRRLDADLRILMADREAAADQAAQLRRELDESRARAERLRAQVRSLVHAPQSVQGMSERVRSMLRMAQDEVADMLARSEAEVTRRRQETDRYLADVIATAHANADAISAAARVEAERSAAADVQARAKTEQECDTARAVVAAERAESERQLAEAAEQARSERARDWSAAEVQRALVEEDFTLAMDQRRSEALAELTAERAETQRRLTQILATATNRSRDMAAEADRTVSDADRIASDTVTEADRTAKEMVADAERTAKAMVTEAQRRVDELIAVRGLVTEQLRNGRGVMDVALGGLEAEAAGERAALAAAQAHNSRAQPGSTTNGSAADHNADHNGAQDIPAEEGQPPKSSSEPSLWPRATDQVSTLTRH